MKKKKVICFDFDGTLADTFAFEKFAIVEAIHHFGHPEITIDNIEEYFGPTEPGVVKKFVSEEEFPIAESYFYQIYLEYQNKLLKKVPEIVAFLRELKKQPNIHLVIVTGRALKALNISLSYLDMEGIFEAFYAGSLEGINKQYSMQQVQNDFHCEKEDMIYIGDTVTDIEVMQRYHYDILSVSYFHDGEHRKKLLEKNPGNVADSLKELSEKIYQLI